MLDEHIFLVNNQYPNSLFYFYFIFFRILADNQDSQYPNSFKSLEFDVLSTID
jgi:hypothetical protein